MAERQTKIKGCGNGRDHFSMGIVIASGWSSVNEEHARGVWALSQCRPGTVCLTAQMLLQLV